MYVILQRVDQEIHHAKHVENKGEELCPLDLLVVDIPVATQQTADKFSWYDLLVLCIIKNID